MAIGAVLVAAAVVGFLVLRPQPPRVVAARSLELERLLSTNPLPTTIQLIWATPEMAVQLTVIQQDWRPAPPPPAGLKVQTVSEIAMVPAVGLLDPRTDLQLLELTALRSAQDLEVLPLRDVGPPSRALAVDGRYPGDPDYPLVSRVAVAWDASVPELAAWARNLPAPATAKAVSWVAAVGDVMPGRGVDLVLLQPDGLQQVFGDLLPVLQGADLTLGNLEAVATRRGAPAAKTFTFRFEPAALNALRAAGFDYLSVANNHAHDFGAEGFLDSLSALEAAGLATSGAGPTQDAARQPHRITLPDGTPVMLLSVGAHPVERSGFDGRQVQTATADRAGILWADTRALQLIQESVRPGELGVVMVHGGAEWTHAPSDEVISLYRSFIDAGARLVVGSHPHFLQGYEAYAGGLILYSMGNFVFPGMQATGYGEQSAVARVGVWDGEIRYLEFVPARLNGRRVTSGPDSTLRRLRELSAELLQRPSGIRR